MTPVFLTKTEVAELFRCSVRQVELLVKRGRIIPPVYLGDSSPRWHREQLLASILQTETEAEQ